MAEHRTTPVDGPLKIGVMSFAHTHAAGYLHLLRGHVGVEVLGSDPGPHPAGEVRGAQLASELGVAYVDTYDELLEWGPHGVVITAENARHRELVERAAAVGAHILCEKPLATTLEDGLAIRAAVRRAGVTLTVAFPVRFASAFRRLQSMHEDGALGDLVAVRGSNNGKLPLERGWFTDPELAGGGALVDHVVHVADLLEALMASAPVAVTAVSNGILHADRARAETAGLVTISYANGVVAAVDSSWSQPDTAPTWGGLKIAVTGTLGSVDIDFFGPRVKGLQSATGRPLELPYGAGFDDRLLMTFLDAVRTGVQPQPDVEVGLRTLRIVLAAQESARSGRTVRLDEG